MNAPTNLTSRVNYDAALPGAGRQFGPAFQDQSLPANGGR